MLNFSGLCVVYSLINLVPPPPPSLSQMQKLESKAINLYGLSFFGTV